jgi:hypothetical protein
MDSHKVVGYAVNSLRHPSLNAPPHLKNRHDLLSMRVHVCEPCLQRPGVVLPIHVPLRLYRNIVLSHRPSPRSAHAAAHQSSQHVDDEHTARRMTHMRRTGSTNPPHKNASGTWGSGAGWDLVAIAEAATQHALREAEGLAVAQPQWTRAPDIPTADGQAN